MNDENDKKIDLHFNNGKYKYVRGLSRGNYGDIYLAKDRLTGEKTYVLKVYTMLNKEDELKRTEIESNIIRKLNCENMIEFVESFREDNNTYCYLVTEWCSGGDLRTLIDTCRALNRKLAEDQVLDYTRQLFNALSFLHSHEIIHKDINPQNIFLNHRKQLKLGLIGLATSYEYLKRTSTVLTDYSYISPEIIENQKFTDRSDVWSSACVVYELITLEKAFKGRGEMEVFKVILNDKIPEVEHSMIVGNLLSKMFIRRPDYRPTSQMIVDLCSEITEKNGEIIQSIVNLNMNSGVIPKFQGGRFVFQRNLSSDKTSNINLYVDIENKNQKVVIKTLTGISKDEKERFTREANHFNELRLKDPINSSFLMHMITQFTELGLFCVVYEFCDNYDLSNVIDSLRVKQKRLEFEILRKQMIELMSGLKFLHDHGMVHRNLRPKNVFIDAQYQIKIGDFMAARSSRRESTTTNQQSGGMNSSSSERYNKSQALNYTPPELISMDSLFSASSTLIEDDNEISETSTEAKEVTSSTKNKRKSLMMAPTYRDRIDIWAAGCIMFELASLRKAFDGQNLIELQNSIKMSQPELSVDELSDRNNREFYEKLRDVIKKMMNKTASERPSAERVRDDMRNNRSLNA